jgi:hypothetical protein
LGEAALGEAVGVCAAALGEFLGDDFSASFGVLAALEDSPAFFGVSSTPFLGDVR